MNVFKKRRETWIFGTLIALFVLAVALQTIPDESAELASIPASLNGVVVIPIYGTIQITEGDFLTAGGIDGVVQALESVEDDHSIKAVILRVNSPGGSVASSQQLFQDILDFKKRSKKPVVVSIVDSGASGAYWVSLAADRIVAEPGSLVGSIGVIAQTPDLTRIRDRWGVGMNTFKSGEMKDMMNPWRAVTPQDQALIQQLISGLHKQFVNVVSERRHLPLTTVEKLADGRVFTGQQALELGLIDELGGLEEASLAAGKLAGIKGRPKLVRRYQNSWRQLMHSVSGMTGFQVPALNSLEVR